MAKEKRLSSWIVKERFWSSVHVLLFHVNEQRWCAPKRAAIYGALPAIRSGFRHPPKRTVHATQTPDCKAGESLTDLGAMRSTEAE